MEYILPDQQDAFVKELEPHVLKCVKDANGNHVELFALFCRLVTNFDEGHTKASRTSRP